MFRGMGRMAWTWAIATVGLLACGDDSGGGADGGAVDAPTVDADLAADAAVCTRTPGPANATRRIVVSHPYAAGSAPSSAWEVLDVDPSGALSRPDRTFTMGRAIIGTIAFTPDGQVGVVAQDDGSVGVFTLDANGTPTVVAAKLTYGFYATGVVMDPDGSRAYVIDTNWRENGGGVSVIGLDCAGNPSDLGKLFDSKLPAALAFTGDGRAVLAATDVDGSTAGDDVDLLTWGAAPSFVDGVDAFGDDEAIVAGAALTHDGKFFLVGDNSQFASVPNRVAVVGVGPAGLTATQVLSPIEDPVAIVASPYDDAALVVSGFGNAFFHLSYAPGAAPPFALVGQLAYQGAKPQLPAGAVMIDRGALTGRVFVAENLGVRVVQFHQGAAPTDEGLFSLGSGTEQVTGAIGVTP
jgi:hypothetical protein